MWEIIKGKVERRSQGILYLACSIYKRCMCMCMYGYVCKWQTLRFRLSSLFLYLFCAIFFSLLSFSFLNPPLFLFFVFFFCLVVCVTPPPRSTAPSATVSVNFSFDLCRSDTKEFYTLPSFFRLSPLAWRMAGSFLCFLLKEKIKWAIQPWKSIQRQTYY